MKRVVRFPLGGAFDTCRILHLFSALCHDSNVFIPVRFFMNSCEVHL